MSLAAGGAVALAAALDRVLSEPPVRLHPVSLLGALVNGLDSRLPDAVATGLVLAALVPLAFALAAGAVVLVAGPAVATVVGIRSPWPAVAVAGAVLFVCSSRRMLVDLAGRVVDLTETDPEAARESLRALAGRDASALSPGRLRSAAVESAAENLADGLLAPLLAFGVAAVLAGATLPAATVGDGRTVAVLALATGAAAWVKAVNTLDSMLGYPHRRAGRVPARLDDLVMWVPARIAAVALAAAGTPTRIRLTLRRARTAAREPASPNSGWPMATIAAVLNVRLEKPGAYVLFPDRPLPTAVAAREGVRTVSRAGWLSIGVVVAVVVGT